MPERKTLNEDLFYRGSSANLLRLHTCKNKVPFWDFSQFAVTISTSTLNEIFQNITSVLLYHGHIHEYAKFTWGVHYIYTKNIGIWKFENT